MRASITDWLTTDYRPQLWKMDGKWVKVGPQSSVWDPRREVT